MDASRLLKKQGWRGLGHTLHPTDDSTGLARPLLLSRKDDRQGLGIDSIHRKAAATDQWWLEAFDQQCKNMAAPGGAAAAKSAAKVPTRLEMIAGNHGANKYRGAYGLYASFVRGETIGGTMGDRTSTSTSSSSTSKTSSAGEASTAATTPEQEDSAGAKTKESQNKKRKRGNDDDDGGKPARKREKKLRKTDEKLLKRVAKKKAKKEAKRVRKEAERAKKRAEKAVAKAAKAKKNRLAAEARAGKTKEDKARKPKGDAKA